VIEVTVSVVSALTALGSLWFTERQWQKVNKKIAMLSDAEAAIDVLPAWYTARMFRDHWFFGLRTTDGLLIAISRIKAISDDGKWMDVELLTADELPKIKEENVLVAVADDRRKASVQIEKIVAAYDLVTS
jgi:hypothetical protein